jgi:BNR repeat-like domain
MGRFNSAKKIKSLSGAASVAFLSLTIATLLVSPVLSSASVASSQVTFGSAINLSNDNGYAQTPNVQALGSNVYAVWSEGSGGILFRASSNYGASWGATRKISVVSGNAQRQVLMSDNGSNVYVVWPQQVGSTGLQIFESTITDYGNGPFTTTQLTHGNFGFTVPVVASWGSDVVVAYGNGSNSKTASVLWYTMSTNAGASWSAPSNYGFGCSSGCFIPEPQVYIWENHVYVVGDYGFVESPNSGKSWNIVKIPALDNAGREPWIWGYGPNVFVAWFSEPSGGTNQIYYVYSNNNGESWSAVGDLSTSLPDSINPMVWAFGNTSWVAVVQHPGSSEGKIWVYTSTNAGKSWSSPALLSGPGQVSYPWTVASSDGQNVFVGYSQKTSFGWIVRVGYSSNGGLSWSSPPSANASGNTKGKAGQAQDQADTAIASSGAHCYAVWQYISPSGASQIYFSSS